MQQIGRRWKTSDEVPADGAKGAADLPHEGAEKSGSSVFRHRSRGVLNDAQEHKRDRCYVKRSLLDIDEYDSRDHCRRRR